MPRLNEEQLLQRLAELRGASKGVKEPAKDKKKSTAATKPCVNFSECRNNKYPGANKYCADCKANIEATKELEKKIKQDAKAKAEAEAKRIAAAKAKSSDKGRKKPAAAAVSDEDEDEEDEVEKLISQIISAKNKGAKKPSPASIKICHGCGVNEMAPGARKYCRDCQQERGTTRK